MVDEIRTDLQPPLSAAARRRRRWRRVISSGLTVIAIAVLGGGAWWGLQPRIKKCYGMEQSPDSGQCYGVTDGSTIVHPGLEDVERRIKDENDRVARDSPGQVVTVAVLTPVPADVNKGSSDPFGPPRASLQQVRAQLEGAHVAQVRTNEGDSKPEVRLLLADEGPNEKQWDAVTKELVNRAKTENLVAVTGLGVSSRETKWGAGQLDSAGLPMIGSVITADKLNASATPNRGLYRVSPGNSDEVAALARAESEKTGGEILVTDSLKDDLYTEGLAVQFMSKFEPERSLPYQGQADTVGNQFLAIREAVCAPNGPSTVLYAGRINVFKDLVGALGNHVCGGDKEITVVTGSDGAAAQEIAIPPGVHVVYAALAAPEVLGDPRLNRDGYDTYNGKFASKFRELFGPGDLENGWGIMSYDAMEAADTAIHLATRVQGSKPPNSAAVKGILQQMGQGAAIPVTGTGGPFSFDTEGRPVGQRIDVMRLDPERKKPVVVRPDDNANSGQ